VSGDAKPAPSLTTQALWLMVAKTVGFAFSIALPLLLVRRLSQQDLGLYKQVFLVVLMSMNVLPLGFGMSAFYFLPRERSRQGAVIANILVFYAASGLAAACVLFAWPGVLPRLFNSGELAAFARPLGVVVLLWTVGSFLELVTVALQDVRASTAFIVLTQTSKTALLVAAAVVTGSVGGLVTAAIAQGLVQILVMLIYLHRRVPGFWRAFDGALMRKQAAYALPLGLSSILIQSQDSVHHFFVSYAFGPAGYAIYAVGVFQLPLIGILRESAAAVILPRINQLESENNRREILELVANAARKLALVYLPLFAFLMVTGRDLVVLLFTARYAESWPIFAVSLLPLPLSVLVLDPVTRAHEERFFFLRLRVAVLAAVVTVLWTSASALGLVGVISVVVAATYFMWVVAAIRMARLLSVQAADLVRFRPVAAIALSVSVAAVATAAVRFAMAGQRPFVVLAVAAPVFAAVYAVALWVCGVLATEEITALWRDLRRLRPGSGVVSGAALPLPTGPAPAGAGSPSASRSAAHGPPR
jgi:O-antigen/teichoic acid export membrane protein